MFNVIFRYRGSKYELVDREINRLVSAYPSEKRSVWYSQHKTNGNEISDYIKYREFIQEMSESASQEDLCSVEFGN
jgi:hypothetical protein